MPGNPKPFARPPVCPPEIEGFAKQLKSPLAIAQLLWQKGICDTEAARAYLAPKIVDDPQIPAMKNLPELVNALIKLREQKGSLLIHGDYDVDGIAGAAVLYMGLKDTGIALRTFLPHRFRDGYGLTMDNVRKFASEGVTTIITVDTGISAVDEIALAKELGICVYITDHHQPPANLPPAELIINPNQADCPYPHKSLSGTGVAYRVIEAVRAGMGLPMQTELLQYVALASLADMAPLTPDNRALIRLGLKQLRTTTVPGLMALLQESNLYGHTLTASEILFRLTPMINAAGRLKSPDLALELFCAPTMTEARSLVFKLKKLNEKRKELDRSAYIEAIEMERSGKVDIHQPILVFYHPTWHEGVIGIIAAKLVDRYRKPVLVATNAGDHLRGSGRTIEGFSIHAQLGRVSHLLEKWGGHEAAVGFNLKLENLESFTKEIQNLPNSNDVTNQNEVMSAQDVSELELCMDRERALSKASSLKCDVHLLLSDINMDLIPWLGRFEPLGPGNEAPIFYTEGLQLAKPPILMGEHIRFSVTDGTDTREAIAFSHADWSEPLQKATSLNLVYFLDKNSFRQRETLQMRVLTYSTND